MKAHGQANDFAEDLLGMATNLPPYSAMAPSLGSAANPPETLPELAARVDALESRVTELVTAMSRAHKVFVQQSGDILALKKQLENKT